MDIKDFIKESLLQIVEGIMRVDFDLAVTVTQSDKIKAGGGLSIASLGKLGASSEDASKNEEISRIKYTIPIALPELDKK